MRDFHKLIIWQRSHQLTLAIYRISKSFPKEEIFGLTSQMRRAVSSIPTNIAEGCGRASNKDFAHFLQIAIGSATEVEYQLLLAHDINYINDDDYQALTDETVVVRKMIIKYQSELKSSSSLEARNSQQ
ncbi:MAG: four helix bundle protein [Bacteroidales bacterium]|jgi:four helix bundle protein|nr:four helix bundle protein [Bacteroidales bacterium]